MPSKKVNDVNDVYYDENLTLEDLEWMDYDEDGNPFIYPDEFNLKSDHKAWSDLVLEDVQDLYKLLNEFVYDRGSPMLEKLNFHKFFIFIANNSYKTHD